MSMGQDCTSNANCLPYQIPNTTLAAYQAKCRSNLPPSLVILRFDPASAISGQSKDNVLGSLSSRACLAGSALQLWTRWCPDQSSLKFKHV